MLKMPKRRTTITAVAVVFLIALPCAYIGHLWRAWGPTVSVYRSYGDLSENPNEGLIKYGKEYYVEATPHFKDVSRKLLIIPHDATDIMLASVHSIHGGYWVAFTVPMESLSSVLTEITGHNLSDFKDGMKELGYIKPPKGPYGKDRRKAAPYWNVDSVKNGKHLEEEYDYCAVDVDACRIFLRIR